MRSNSPVLSSLALAAVLAVPAVIATAPRLQAQKAVVKIRVHDPYHKDFHEWDDREDLAYRAYLTERHREYRVYRRLKHPEQRLYWNWRHEHPDHDDRR
jgi:hypothetical protein